MAVPQLLDMFVTPLNSEVLLSISVAVAVTIMSSESDKPVTSTTN